MWDRHPLFTGAPPSWPAPILGLEDVLVRASPVERVKEQFPALLEYFNKLPKVDKKIKPNDKYKRIMSILTLAEIIVQLYFLQDVKPAFDRFLEVCQTEGTLIHVLHPSMPLLLKQLMQRFLKVECIG